MTVTCSLCNGSYKSRGSLRVHKHIFHRGSDSKVDFNSPIVYNDAHLPLVNHESLVENRKQDNIVYNFTDQKLEEDRDTDSDNSDNLTMRSPMKSQTIRIFIGYMSLI